jgi:ParB family chromosome partitioning protein
MNVQELLVLPLDQVAIPPDRLREVDPERVKSIAVSMGEVGQITPIEVQPADAEGRYVLNTGAHRMMAARLAGIETIQATVFDGDPDQRRLREIDENLYRAELTPFDQAAFLAERLDIFKRQHGPLGKGRPKKSGASSHRFLFYAEVEGRFGLSVEVVKKALARFEAFSADERAQLRMIAPLLSGSDLDKLKAMREGERGQIVQRLMPTGNAVRTLADILREIGDAEAPETAIERVQRLFLRLPPTERREFLTWARAHDGRGRGA